MRRVAPVNPAGFNRQQPRAVAERAPVRRQRGGQPRAGRKPGSGERRFKTLREKVRTWETAQERAEHNGRDSDWADAREFARRAVAFAVEADIVAELPEELVRWARQEGLLQDVAEAASGQAAPAPTVTAAPAVPAQTNGAATPTPHGETPAGAPSSVPVTPPASQEPAPPPTPLFMGLPADRVALFAGVALPVIQELGRRFGTEGLDTTTHVRATLFRGTPLQREVDCVPAERMAELAGVVAAKRWPAAGGGAGDPASAAKTELVVLGLAAFGPALVTAGKRVAGALWEMGRGLGARIKARRGGEAPSDA
ncbi:hypothetical protein [Archangium sp.]|uniref:hypothetical protein n=1 Tax=Archangium sp. TaxID=1872627 RepID=UPI00286B5351|nr:hypothetical protein [Archangium sp.]